MTEQNIIDLLFFVLRELIGNTMYFIFLASILTPKYNKWLTISIQSLVSLGIYYVVESLNGDITFFTFVIIFTLCALLLYKEKNVIVCLPQGYSLLQCWFQICLFPLFFCISTVTTL